MLPDSLLWTGALALFVSAVAAWRLAAGLAPRARIYLRFACVLLAALAVAAPVRLGDSAALFLLPLASASLVLSASARFARPFGALGASLVLVASLASGLAAAIFGFALLALAPVMLAALAIVALSLQGLAVTACLSGLALVAADLVFLEQGAGAGLMLFAAAALLGLSQLLRSSSSAMRGAALP